MGESIPLKRLGCIKRVGSICFEKLFMNATNVIKSTMCQTALSPAGFSRRKYFTFASMKSSASYNADLKPYFLLMAALAVLLNFAGINTLFFSDDPGLYASISKQLIYKHSFFELYSYGQHWLDKPHFPFWMVFFSFKIFGISTWAYKLPALLFFLMGLFYTWLFSKKYYGRDAAFMAVLIVATSLHVMMSNTDVRAEPYLMGLIIGSIYHLSQLQERYKTSDLILAAFFTACAIMTKGLFVLVAIYGALFGQLILQRKFSGFFQWRWLALVLLTSIFVLPEIYALYIQFDAHPERTVFGRQNVSGIKFFLWDSQFGRFFNNGPIKRSSGSIFFFMHTMLWAFAPWCLLFFYAVFKRIKDVVKGEKLKEYYVFSGGLLLLLLFSLSGFQLPFYTNILFPLFGVMIAGVITQPLSKSGRIYFNTVLILYSAAFIVVICGLQFLLKTDALMYFMAGIFLLSLLAVFITKKVKPLKPRLFLLTCSVMLFVQFYLITAVYPLLTMHKGEITAAEFVNERSPQLPVYSFTMQNNMFQFYCNRPVQFIPMENFEKVTDKTALFFVNENSMKVLRQRKTPFKLVGVFSNYNEEIIKPKFLNRNTRTQMLTPVYLISHF